MWRAKISRSRYAVPLKLEISYIVRITVQFFVDSALL
jgi:hypothetical protein